MSCDRCAAHHSDTPRTSTACTTWFAGGPLAIVRLEVVWRLEVNHEVDVRFFDRNVAAEAELVCVRLGGER